MKTHEKNEYVKKKNSPHTLFSAVRRINILGGCALRLHIII